jgi:formate hydrogenlyase subunit 3/multisubunit Na+/H+ antiporter MnhD subunit
MIVATAIWAFYERNVSRLFGFIVLFESGCLLLLLSLQLQLAIEILFLSLFPRALALALAGISISVMLQKGDSGRKLDISGSFRDYPFASSGLVISFLSVIGFPLLAGFPYKLILFELLKNLHPEVIIWMTLGLIGMLVPVVNLLIKMTRSEKAEFKINENWIQISLISVGGLLLILMGLFPNIIREIFEPLLQYLPKII